MDLSRKAAMFYGSEYSDLKPANGEFAFVGSLGGLYRLLLGCWRRETCAPRLQEKWSESNPTCGQCSITAFLAQRRGGGVTKLQVGVVVNFGMSTLKEGFLRFVNNLTEPQLRASAPLREDNPTATSIANICF